MGGGTVSGTLDINVPSIESLYVELVILIILPPPENTPPIYLLSVNIG